MSGASRAGALMSALWTRGCAGSESARVLAAHPGSLTSGVTPPVPTWPLPALAQGTQKSWFDDDLSRVWPTARGWGCIGRGLCVLHESPDPVEYTRPSASGSRPSCSSGGVRSDSRAEGLIEPAPRPGAPCTPEPACSSTPRPGVSRFCSPVSTTLRSRPPGASTSA